jgi:hypothetical protein
MFGKGRGKDKKKRKRRIGRKLARAANRLNKKVGNAARRVESAALKREIRKAPGALKNLDQYEKGVGQIKSAKNKDKKIGDKVKSIARGYKNTTAAEAKLVPYAATELTRRAAKRVKEESRRRKY